MGGKNYLNLFLLFAILAQETGALFNRIEESSDPHVRRKRLIDRSLDGNRPITIIENILYILSLHENGEFMCSTNILLINVLITTAVCAMHKNKPEAYSVLSGSAYRQAGSPHSVLKIRHHPEFRDDRLTGDIALLTINPSIINELNRPIPLNNADVRPYTPATTSGWGYTNVRRTIHPDELRSITLPIISVEECREIFINRHELRRIVRQFSDKIICTHDRSMEKHASYFDHGNPLVVNGRLAGIMIWTLRDGLPDIYVNLTYPTYKAWINRKLGQIAISPP